MILVDTDEICAAIKDVFEDTRAIVEPSAALGVAGAKRYVEREGVEGRTSSPSLCGANMNFDRLRFVAERAELGEAREAVFAVTIPERPGSFKEFCRLLGAQQHHRVQLPLRRPDGGARLRRRRACATAPRRTSCCASIERAGIRTLDLTDNEIAKLHVRHLVGGPRERAERDPLPLRVPRAARAR